MQNFRDFASGPDPFGRMWQVQLKWLQTAISIRHSDTVDVKFILRSDGEVSEKTIALPHLALRQAAERLKVTMSDAWCARIAVAHLQFLIESGDDMDKDLVTLDAAQVNGYADDLSRAEPAQQRAAN
jgi:hypothetical protein